MYFFDNNLFNDNFPLYHLPNLIFSCLLLANNNSSLVKASLSIFFSVKSPALDNLEIFEFKFFLVLIIELYFNGHQVKSVSPVILSFS